MGSIIFKKIYSYFFAILSVCTLGVLPIKSYTRPGIPNISLTCYNIFFVGL